MQKSSFLIVTLLLLLSSVSRASSPIGTWKTIDDATGKAMSLVHIMEQDDTLVGRVQQILNEQKRTALCDRCKGENKDRKIEGMKIIWDMRPNGSHFDHGKILDPSSGKIYSATMKLLENGKKLEVRGYLGLSLFGRSQVWERVQ